MADPMAQIAALQREIVSQQTGRMATVLAAPNAKREIINKHRPTHWVNLVRDANGKLVVGSSGNAYTIVGKLPIGFEFDRAVFDESDATNWGIVDFQIEKYKANSGKGTAAQDPGPLTGIHAMLSREDAWGPSGFFDKQVGTSDLDVTLIIFCWKSTQEPFDGIQLLGKDHTNYCPLTGRVVQASRGFKLLPQLGKSSSGLVSGLVQNMGVRANAVIGNLQGMLGGRQERDPREARR